MRRPPARPRSPVPVLRAPTGLRYAPLPSPDGELALLHWSTPLEPPLPPSLTAAEAAIVELVLRGLSTEEIAALRGRSTRTIGNQLASVYRKLGVGSRAQLAAQVASDGNVAR